MKFDLLSDKQKGYLAFLGAILAYSSMPVLIRVLDDGDMPASAQVFLRYIVSFGFALAYLVSAKAEFKLKKNIPLLLLVAFLGYALTNLFFTYSVVNTEIGNALFIFYSFGIIAPVFAFVFLGEKFNKYNWVGLVLTFFGLLLLFRPNSFDTWQLGAVYAFASAIGQSIYIVGRRKLSQYSASMIMVVNTFVGILSIGLFSLIYDTEFYFQTGGIDNLAVETWLVTGLFGFLNFSAWFLVNKGFEYTKTATGSILMMGENVLALLWAAIFFAEYPSITLLGGGILIVLATVMIILKGDKS